MAETNLDALIRSMQPELHAATYVFATVTGSVDAEALKPVMQFSEVEGLTLIVEHQRAIDAGLQYDFPCRMISLNIHSSLDAVGFLARITTHLAKLNMGVNPVSGFYHDHLFVPAARADEAFQALQSLSQEG